MRTERLIRRKVRRAFFLRRGPYSCYRSIMPGSISPTTKDSIHIVEMNRDSAISPCVLYIQLRLGSACATASLDLTLVYHIYNCSTSLKVDSETGFERAPAQSGQGSGCSHLG